MPVNSQANRAYVSLSALAEEILGLSRARVYELIERGALPTPIYDLRTRRPMFNEELQRQALQVRQSGIGIDGQAIIFYRRRAISPASSSSAGTLRNPRRRAQVAPPLNSHADLIAGLQGLGITQANETSVASALAELFPGGAETGQQADTLRALFRHFRRRQSA
ncbi:MAG: hypothetical protein ABSH08_14020 [Tepidisphaeraceae bacterium]